MNKTYTTLKNEDGAVLVAGLMILAVLTLLGIAAISTSTIEVQIAGNDKFSKVAFYAAEGAVQEGLNWLESKHDLSYHLVNATNLNENSNPPAPAVVDPTVATPGPADYGKVEQVALGDATYAYQIVSLDPDPNLPNGYTARPRTQVTEGFNANQGSAYVSTTRVYNYYYQVEGRGTAGKDSISTINATASYLSEN